MNVEISPECSHRRLSLFLILVLIVPFVLADPVFAEVLISQVLYDPLGSDAGGEAVELYNPSNASVNISGWQLATGVSTSDVILPPEALMLPKSYFLIADAGWDSERDDPEWPGADHQETMTLFNSDSGVALLVNGSPIDSVGWGLPDDPLLFEGRPAEPVAAGLALRRTDKDSNDNMQDFYGGSPLWHNSSMGAGTGWQMQLEVIVSNQPPRIASMALLADDLEAEGVQLSPVPGALAGMPIEVVVDDRNGLEDVVSVEAEVAGITLELTLAASSQENESETQAVYKGTLLFPHYLAAGTYDIQMTVVDAAGGLAVEYVTLEYLELLALELDTPRLVMELSGTATIATGDMDMETTSSPTIRNMGNTELDLQIAAQDIVGIGASIPADALGYQVGEKTGRLAGGQATINLSLQPGQRSLAALNLTLDTNVSYPLGVYRSVIDVSPLVVI